MSKNIIGFAACALLFPLCLSVGAQQPTTVYRIGSLSGGSVSTSKRNNDAFRDGLRTLGYVQGKNILIEYRYAEGKRERSPELAAELVRLKVDVILVGGTQTATAAKQATSTIPIVVGSAGDLVGSGLVASLARPGGNITGSTDISPDLSGKRLELLKEAVPKASRVAVLLSPSAGTDSDEMKQTKAAAQALKVKIQVVEVKDPSEFQSAYAAMKKENANALILNHSSFTNFHRKQLIELVTKNGLPTMCEELRWTEDGCLISYGSDQNYQWVRAAVFVDKILKGRKPADLPVEQPMRFEFVVNLKTAKQIGVTIPQSVLFRADRVIK